MKSRIIRFVVIFSILIINIGCDQISKNIVRRSIDSYQEISVIKNYVTLTKVENAGAFLSIGDSLPDSLRFLLLTLLPLVMLGFGVGFLFLKNNLPKPVILGFTFVMGGGIGNIYDRLMHGTVTDFLHIDFGIFQTGIFNLADVSIMLGVLMVLLDSIVNGRTIGEEITE
jgi:signal peptidase II